MLSLLKGLGSSILQVDGVRNLLFELLDRQNKSSFRLDKYGKELSKVEVEILCLLLEVMIKHT